MLRLGTDEVDFVERGCGLVHLGISQAVCRTIPVVFLLVRNFDADHILPLQPGEVDQGKPLEDIGADKQRERKLFGIDRGLPDGAVRPIHTAAPVASLHRFYIGLSVRLIIIGVEVVTYDRLQFPGFQRPLGRPDIEPPAEAEPVERTYGQLAALAGVIHQRLECAEEAFYARVGVARMEVLFEILQPGLVHVEQLDRPVLGIPSDNMPQRLVAGRRIVFLHGVPEIGDAFFEQVVQRFARRRFPPRSLEQALHRIGHALPFVIQHLVFQAHQFRFDKGVHIHRKGMASAYFLFRRIPEFCGAGEPRTSVLSIHF